MAIYRGQGGSGDAIGDASSQATVAVQKAAEASLSAAQSATSATAAASSAVAAIEAATSASTSASTSSTNASDAAASAASASSSAATATTKASEASTSAANAATSASSASSSASSASSSASSASTSATNAASSATAADSAKVAAQSAQTAAEAAYDSFDDRYLGAKSSDPTVDNDGNALLTGALYFNTSSNVMKAYTGSGWVVVANAGGSGGTPLLAVNNLSDLNNTTTARTNLGLAAVAATGAYSDLTGKPTLFSGSFTDLTSKPTTLSGYGIADAQPLDGDLTAIAGLSGTTGILKKTAADTWTLDTSSYLTSNQSITFSGDVSGSGTTSVSLTLANSGVTAGTYNNADTTVTPFTVDAKGRITGTGSPVTITPAFSNVTGKPTTLSGYGITDAQATLVSGTNIKTINGSSVLGSGDLTVGAGFTGGTVTTSSTDITLTASSTQVQRVAMTTIGKRVILPNATTVSTAGGGVFIIANYGAQSFDIADSNGLRIRRLKAGESTLVSLASKGNTTTGWVFDASNELIGTNGKTTYAIDPSPTTYSPFNWLDVAYHSDTSVVAVYVPTNLDAYLVAGTIDSNGAITWGTPVVAVVGSADFCGIRALTSTLGCMYYATTAGMNPAMYEVSGTTITIAPRPASTGASGCDVVPIDSSRVAVVYDSGVKVLSYNNSTTAPAQSSGVSTSNGTIFANRAALIDTDTIFTIGFRTGTTGAYNDNYVKLITTVGSPTTTPVSGTNYNLGALYQGKLSTAGLSTTGAQYLPRRTIWVYSPNEVAIISGALDIAPLRIVYSSIVNISAGVLTAGAKTSFYFDDNNYSIPTPLTRVIGVQQLSQTEGVLTYCSDDFTMSAMQRVKYIQGYGLVAVGAIFNTTQSNSPYFAISGAGTKFVCLGRDAAFTGAIINP